jgi:hypothetical protein
VKLIQVVRSFQFLIPCKGCINVFFLSRCFLSENSFYSPPLTFDPIWFIFSIKPKATILFGKEFYMKDHCGKKRLLPKVVLVLGLVIEICSAQTFLWEKSYGGEKDDLSQTLVTLPDQSVVVAGSTTSFGAGRSDIWLLCINQNGDTIWTKTFGEAGYEVPVAMVVQQDKTLLLLGYSNSYTPGGNDLLLMKITFEGKMLWTKTYGGAADEVPRALLSLPDGGVLLGGVSQSATVSSILIRVDSTGTQLWQIEIPTSDLQTMVSLQDTSVLIGVTSYRYGDMDILLSKISITGKTLWTKIYGKENDQMLKTMLVRTDGSAFMLYNTNGDTRVMKVAPNGDSLWSQTLSPLFWDYPIAMYEVSQKSIVIAGKINDCPGLMKLHTDNGSIALNFTSIEHQGFDCSVFHYQADTSVIFAGKDYDFYGGASLHLIKLSATGSGACVGDWCGNKKNGDISTRILLPMRDGSILYVGERMVDPIMNTWDLFAGSFIDFLCAYKDAQFSFKLTHAKDSLNFGFVPIEAPSDMKVSPGGTITWIPRTVETYWQKVSYLIVNDFGYKDTIRFRIWVNSIPLTGTKKPAAQAPNPDRKNITMSFTQAAKEVRFLLPEHSLSFKIFDMHGRMVRFLQQNGNGSITWDRRDRFGVNVRSGVYIAIAEMGSRMYTRTFRL